MALVGPDVVVTEAWMEQLVALANADPAIGMAGPVSLAATPKILAESLDIDVPGELDAFAARWRAGRRGKWSHGERSAATACS